MAVECFDLELEGVGVIIVSVKVGSCFIGARPTGGSGKSVHPPLGVDKVRVVVNADGVTCIGRGIGWENTDRRLGLTSRDELSESSTVAPMNRSDNRAKMNPREVSISSKRTALASWMALGTIGAVIFLSAVKPPAKTYASADPA